MPSAERTCRALIEAGVSVRRAARAAGVSPRQLRRYREHWPAPSPATRAARAEQRLIEAEAAHRGGCQRWKPGRPYDALAMIERIDRAPRRPLTVAPSFRHLSEQWPAGGDAGGAKPRAQALHGRRAEVADVPAPFLVGFRAAHRDGAAAVRPAVNGPRTMARMLSAPSGIGDYSESRSSRRRL